MRFSSLNDLSQKINEHRQAIDSVAALEPAIMRIAERMSAAAVAGGTIFWLGNGGSAADAQHLAAELMGRFERERKAISSVALSTNSSLLTCLPNDYDYSIIFSRQLGALCKPNDVVVGISTSGNSQNVLLAMETAKANGAFTVGFTGKDGGKLKALVDECLVVDSAVTARIQEAHIFIGHFLCQVVEHEFCKFL